MLERAICIIQSTDSDVILIQKHPHVHIQIQLIKYLGTLWASQVDT